MVLMKRQAQKKRRVAGNKLFHSIDIDVDQGKEIKLGFMGEKFSMAARRGFKVIWQCKKGYPFCIQFATGSDLIPVKKKDNTWEMDVPKNPQLPVYKYMVAVWTGKAVLIGGLAEIIVFPPRK
jgi:hypothetical protein